jgi:molybdopterin molybdotransferase
MPSFDDARVLILRHATPVGVERVPLLECLHRVVAEDVVAGWEMPRFDNSAMDGFAVRAAECSGTQISISGYVPAGAAGSGTLQPGTAMRIMTGAPVPAGCDAVVPFEESEQTDDTFRPLGPVRAGQHIRRAGEDVRRGELIVAAGTMVRPAEISILAAFNNHSVPVYRKPRVAIVSTGDELLEVGKELSPGKIINSNSAALAAAVLEAGGVPLVIGIAADNVESHRSLLRQGLTADALVTSAGVSAGDRDLVLRVLSELGVEQIFAGVDIKPGSPTAFGVKDGHPVFCLPGNPVAALMMFHTLVRPALRKMSGRVALERTVKAVLQDSVRKKSGKARLLRVRLVHMKHGLMAISAGDQNTGMLSTLVRADGLALLCAEHGDYDPGAQVDVFQLSESFASEDE